MSQSAFIPEAENGVYDIWIASDPTYNVAPMVEYEALAEVEYLPDENVAFPVAQRVHRSDGTFADRPAGTVNFHGVHGHYHYSSFANALLWQSNRRGARLGSEPLRAAHKVSFCMADIRIDAWGEKGDGPRTYYAPDCLFLDGEEIDEYRQGINNGWADVYDWYISDRYIEVTGVPSGYYRLEFCADPFNEIEEEDETQQLLRQPHPAERNGRRRQARASPGRPRPVGRPAPSDYYSGWQLRPQRGRICPPCCNFVRSYFSSCSWRQPLTLVRGRLRPVPRHRRRTPCLPANC